MLCAGTLVWGVYNAYGQYYRFAAADAEAGIACLAATASAVTAIADIAASRLRCIQSVALINFLLARGFACSRLVHDTAQHCRYGLLRAIKLNGE